MNDSLITGGAALIGILLGAYLARVSAYSVWLHKRRSEIFSVFLTKVDESLAQAKDLFDNKDKSSNAASVIYPAFASMLNYSKVVRLHLPKPDRERFSMLSNNVWAEYSYAGMNDDAIYRLAERTNEIQEILESALELGLPKWLRWLN